MFWLLHFEQLSKRGVVFRCDLFPSFVSLAVTCAFSTFILYWPFDDPLTSPSIDSLNQPVGALPYLKCLTVCVNVLRI